MQKPVIVPNRKRPLHQAAGISLRYLKRREVEKRIYGTKGGSRLPPSFLIIIIFCAFEQPINEL
jgi:hypothetical protein